VATGTTAEVQDASPHAVERGVLDGAPAVVPSEVSARVGGGDATVGVETGGVATEPVTVVVVDDSSEHVGLRYDGPLVVSTALCGRPFGGVGLSVALRHAVVVTARTCD
jgi:hypothetical protein